MNELELKNYKDAMHVLATSLKKDKSPDSCYYAWQVNIGAAFYDEFCRQSDSDVDIDIARLMSICNNAAKNFLDALIGINENKTNE